tara:strand:+ start:51 stop:335 length:285 start_codon:yes stop_codon:yes gene_type:complete
MAPKLISKNKQIRSEKEMKKISKINNTIQKYQKFIRENFKYVGDSFAYEARTLHYNNKKKEKGIYGTASEKEIKELKEEGINAETIPWIEKKDN